MNALHQSTRRGAALLIALATLIVAVTAAATVARVAATAGTHDRADQATRAADDLLLAVEQPILHWLETKSGSVVLPPDVDEPAVNILHDRLYVGEEQFDVTITAWDQCGMVSPRLLRSGSPVRSAVPGAVVQCVDRVEAPTETVWGLDLFMDEADDVPDRCAVFPRPAVTAPIVFGEPLAESGEFDRPADAERPSAVGAWVATHGQEAPRINVNTAPPEVLEAVMRLAGRGGLDQIITARQEGEPVSLGSLPEGHDREAHMPDLVSRSSAWSFRIDLTIGPWQRSWWVVYVYSSSSSSGGGRGAHSGGRAHTSGGRGRTDSWRCVQRLAITE